MTELLNAWDLDHAVVWFLPVIAVLYAIGFRRVNAQMPDRYPRWRLVSFLSGVALLFLAIASPIHALAEWFLYLHMSQHMLLAMVVPPLLWLGQPAIPMLRALPPRPAKRLLAPILTSSSWRRIGRVTTHPVVCWAALVLAIVVWHLPPFYELAHASDAWHDIQHACFFTGALLFWWPVVQVWPSRSRWPRWAIIPYLLSADVVNTAQSAVLCFSAHPLYPSYAAASRATGLNPLDDQALAGAIMWIPGSVAFLVPAILQTISLFTEREEHAQHRR